MKLLKGEIEGDYIFECSGCRCGHLITTKRKNDQGAQWRFNGNMDEPTFVPSIHIWHTRPDGTKQTDCHFFITVGFIQYLSDCAHSLKGEIIELPDIK